MLSPEFNRARNGSQHRMGYKEQFRKSEDQPLCKENGPQAIWLIEFWCLMINTIRELISFLVFVFIVHMM
jgi:hypothetical protein